MSKRLTLCLSLLVGTMLSIATGVAREAQAVQEPAQAAEQRAAESPAGASAEILDDPAEEEAIVKAKLLLNGKRFARAIDAVESALEKSPTSPRLHLWLGNAYWAICDYRYAVKQFDLAVQNFKDQPKSPEFAVADAQAHRAVCLARLGMYNEAVEGFKQAAKTKTEDVTVSLLIGRALLESEDYQAAIDYLQGDNCQSPNSLEMASNLLLALAQAQAGAGKLEASRSTLDKIIAADQRFPLALIARARLAQKQNRLADALDDANRALTLHKNSAAQAQLIIAQCLFKQNKLPEASAAIDKAAQSPGANDKLKEELSHWRGLIAHAGKNNTSPQPAIEAPSLIVVGAEALSRDKIFSDFGSVVAGDHFLLYGDVSREKLSAYSRLAECFAGYVKANVSPLQGSYPAFLFMLHDKASEQRFLKERLSFGQRVHGVFMTASNAVTTYDGAGTGTFLHEIMHKFLYKDIEHDFWADEGLPAFFEKVYGCFDKELPALELRVGYPQASGKLSGWLAHDNLKLSEVVTTARYADPRFEEAQRMVALFLNDQDKLREFLSLTYAGNRGNYKYFIEAAFDKPLPELDGMFNQYIKRLSSKKALINSLPAAEIFETQAELDAFLHKQKIPTEKF